MRPGGSNRPPALLTSLAPRAAATGAELISVVLAVRLLGLPLYGGYQTAAVAGALGALALDLSRQTTGTRSVAQTLSLPVYQRLSRPRRGIAAGLLAAAAVAYLLQAVWVGAGCCVAAGTMMEQRWGLLAGRRSVGIGASFLIRPSVAILVLGIANTADLSPRLTAQYGLPVAAVVGGGLVALLDQVVAGRHLSTEIVEVRHSSTARSRLPLTLAAVLAAGYVSGDLLLVQLFSNSYQAGLYALAYKPVVAVLALVALLRDLWISDLSSDGPSRRGQTSLTQVVVWSTAISAVLALGTLLVQPLYLLTGSRQADVVTAILMISVVPIVASTWYYAQAVSLNRLAAPLPAVLAALIVDVLANAALIPALGAKGGAIATLLAEVTSTAAAAWVLVRGVPLRRQRTA